MRVYILKGSDNEFVSINNYAAYEGFKQMGWEIIYYKNIEEIENNKREDIIVGCIYDVKTMLKKFNCIIPNLCYPNELKKYLGRKIWKSTLNTIANNPEKWNVFIKPYTASKVFTGILVKDTKDLIGCGIPKSDIDVWCSEPVNFVSEYRCFVRYNKIIGVKHYKGDWKIPFDSKIIQSAVNDYINAPKGYGIDFGVTDKNETLLIEVNDGYSLGSYGLFPINYAKLLSARWAELTESMDYCDFDL